MAQRDRRRMKPSAVHRISAETAQLDNAAGAITVRRARPRPGSRERSIPRQSSGDERNIARKTTWAAPITSVQVLASPSAVAAG
jgi:hypothetical protein